MSDETDDRHGETGDGWEVVARSKYRDELEDYVRRLERPWRPGEVVGALVAAGLTVRHCREHPDLFWNQFPRWPERLRESLPHSCSVLARW